MDISKIKIENALYDLKDAVLRNKVGSANGIATLDANGKVPASQLNMANYVTLNTTQIISGGKTFKGILNIGNTGASSEGGELRLCASDQGTTFSGTILDNYDGKFRIFGIPSTDGTTRTGIGTPLTINPYDKTITGEYNITAGSITTNGKDVLYQGCIIDTHQEGSATSMLDGANELFALYERGGTCTSYEVETSTDLTNATLTPTDTTIYGLEANVFNGIVGYNQGSVYSGSKFAVYDLALPFSVQYITNFFWSFGNTHWKPQKIRILFAQNSTSNYVQVYSSDNCPAFGKVTFDSPETGYRRIRIVLSSYSRLSMFGLTKYNTTGLNTTYVNKSIDNGLYRNFSPGINGRYTIGTSNYKWKAVYANDLYGKLNGNASTATNSDNLDGHPSSYYATAADYIPLFNRSGRSATNNVGFCSGEGQNTWFKIATIVVNKKYYNDPIVFEISQRGYEYSVLQLVFKAVDGYDPEIDSFKSNNSNRYYYRKTATSTWEIWGNYNEVWGTAVLHRVTGSGAGLDITINMENGGTGLTGMTQCTSFGSSETATKLQNSRTLWGNSFDGSGNVTGKISFSNLSFYDEYGMQLDGEYNATPENYGYMDGVQQRLLGYRESDSIDYPYMEDITMSGDYDEYLDYWETLTPSNTIVIGSNLQLRNLADGSHKNIICGEINANGFIRAQGSIEGDKIIDTGGYRKYDLTSNITFSPTNSSIDTGNHTTTFIYTNTTNSTKTITINTSSTMKTPTGQSISIDVPAGGYGEISCKNIDGINYVRAM